MDYFEKDYIKNLPEELKQQLKFIRENYEKINQNQFDWLVEQKVIKQTRKFKNKRGMWVCPDSGKILYLDLYHKAINYCGIFIK